METEHIIIIGLLLLVLYKCNKKENFSHRINSDRGDSALYRDY